VIAAGAAESDGVDGEVVVRVQLRVALERAERAHAFGRFGVKLAPDFHERSEGKKIVQVLLLQTYSHLLIRIVLLKTMVSRIMLTMAMLVNGIKLRNSPFS
jgi:flagellar biosynthesis protein FliP